MSHKFPALEPQHQTFIAAQKIFFVASAAPQGRVNVSPKGMASFAVLGPNAVAYLDCTGSGNETRAHLLANPRLTIMFCAFDGDPVVLRLYGQGRSHLRGGADYAALLPHFEEMPGARQIVTLDVDLVQTSCGMAVPLYDFRDERQNLVRYWTRQGLDGLRKYWGKKNMASIDGLPTQLAPEAMAPPIPASPI
ncbi:MAG: pyridoxamine 5'-phosphate oxidase family protein [Pseudomonadota bacterium]|nr:pyridoxamine 5'-phosphate oxidase family protein [Pseudomonadota bacterium]